MSGLKQYVAKGILSLVIYIFILSFTITDAPSIVAASIFSGIIFMALLVVVWAMNVVIG